MNNYKLINNNTGKTIKEIKAKNTLDIMKKYDLFTRENAHIKIIK